MHLTVWCRSLHVHNKQHNAIVPVSCGLKCHLCFNVHEDIMNFVLKCEHILSGVMMIMYVCSRVSAVVGKSNSYYAGWIEDFIGCHTSWTHARCELLKQMIYHHFALIPNTSFTAVSVHVFSIHHHAGFPRGQLPALQHQSQVLLRGNISDLPPDSCWSYRTTDSAFMVDGLFVWPSRWSGISCRTSCKIRLLAGTVLDNLWRCFCLQRTDAFSALEVSRRCTI